MEEKNNLAHIGLVNNPFGDIALAFSGGGFRAASFALGVLSYLQETPVDETDSTTLLQQVKYLSSTSGGTITSAMYALYSAQGKSFSLLYKDLFEQTEGTKLVAEVLRILNDPKEWKKRPEKSRNLINAFALYYDQFLFQGASIQLLTQNQTRPNSPLEEVCFNTTELYNGLLFRQIIKMKKMNDNPNYGNYYLNLNYKAAKHLKLSDLLAASSCFPGGFEPIVFPHDFINPDITSTELLNGLQIELQELSWSELRLLYPEKELNQLVDSLPHPIDIGELVSKLKELKYNKNLKIPFMDGGITDNQGVESMIHANNRRMNRNEKAFDLMLVCDVASHFMEAFEIKDDGKTNFWSINRIRIISLLVAILSLGFLSLSWIYAPTTFWWNLSQCLAAIVTTASALTFFLTQKIRRIITGQVREGDKLNLSEVFSNDILNLLFKHFGNLRLNLLKSMITNRASSLLTLSNDVFLKRIRYLLYKQFFEIQNLKATGRTKANHIYDLSFSNDLNRTGRANKNSKKDSPRYAPSPALQQVAENAFSMATTLWFTNSDCQAQKQASIIACGQFTTCYNLLDYIAKLKTSFEKRPPIFDQLTPEKQQFVNQLQERMEQDYEKFKADPFWMYNQLGKKYLISDFKEVQISSIKYPENEKYPFEKLR